MNAVSVRRFRVPPLSAQVIECELDAKLGHFLLEPMNGFPDWLLFAKSLNSPCEPGKICVVNMTRHGQIIKYDHLIGQAVQVDEVPPYVAVRKVQPSVGGEPGHIAPFLDDLRAHALREIVCKTIALVWKYAAIFARSDFDLGEFTALDHRFDTDDARPVKQRMHRTRTVFQGDKELEFRQNFSRWCDSAINF